MATNSIMTRREAKTLVCQHYHATRAGWLLAADAPNNKAKGEKLFTALSQAEQAIAERYRDHCRAAYAGGYGG